LPVSVQANARQYRREIWLAPDRPTAETAPATFARTWRRLKGENPSPKVIEGVTVKDGIIAADAKGAA
jgi:hypothetical protein